MTKKRVTDVLDWMELVLYDAPDAESGYTLSPDFALDVIQRARQSLGVK